MVSYCPLPTSRTKPSGKLIKLLVVSALLWKACNPFAWLYPPIKTPWIPAHDYALRLQRQAASLLDPQIPLTFSITFDDAYNQSKGYSQEMAKEQITFLLKGLTITGGKGKLYLAPKGSKDLRIEGPLRIGTKLPAGDHSLLYVPAKGSKGPHTIQLSCRILSVWGVERGELRTCSLELREKGFLTTAQLMQGQDTVYVEDKKTPLNLQIQSKDTGPESWAYKLVHYQLQGGSGQLFKANGSLLYPGDSLSFGANKLCYAPEAQVDQTHTLTFVVSDPFGREQTCRLVVPVKPSRVVDFELDLSCPYPTIYAHQAVPLSLRISSGLAKGKQAQYYVAHLSLPQGALLKTSAGVVVKAGQPLSLGNNSLHYFPAQRESNQKLLLQVKNNYGDLRLATSTLPVQLPSFSYTCQLHEQRAGYQLLIQIDPSSPGDQWHLDGYSFEGVNGSLLVRGQALTKTFALQVGCNELTLSPLVLSSLKGLPVLKLCMLAPDGSKKEPVLNLEEVVLAQATAQFQHLQANRRALSTGAVCQELANALSQLQSTPSHERRNQVATLLAQVNQFAAEQLLQPAKDQIAALDKRIHQELASFPSKPLSACQLAGKRSQVKNWLSALAYLRQRIVSQWDPKKPYLNASIYATLQAYCWVEQVSLAKLTQRLNEQSLHQEMSALSKETSKQVHDLAQVLKRTQNSALKLATTAQKKLQGLDQRLTNTQNSVLKVSTRTTKQLQGFEQGLGKTQSKVSQLADQIAEGNQQVHDLSRALEQTQGKVSQVEEQVAGVSQQVHDLSTDLGQTQGKVSQVEEQAAEVGQQVHDLSTDLEEIQENLNEVAHQVAQQQEAASQQQALASQFQQQGKYLAISPMLQAANPKEALDKALKAGAEVNMADEKGHTPLFDALLAGSAELVEVLLKHGADPSVRNNGGESMLQLTEALIFQTQDWEEFANIMEGRRQIIRAGFKSIYNRNAGEDALYQAMKKSDKVMKRRFGQGPLSVYNLLADGSNPNAYSNMYYYTNWWELEALLAYGGLVNQPVRKATTDQKVQRILSYYLTLKNSQGDTGLHQAFYLEKGQARQQFIQKILTCMEQGPVGGKKKLLAAKDKQGRTALHLAIATADAQAFERLCQAGIPAEQKHLQGQTIAAIVHQPGHDELLRIFQQYQGNIEPEQTD